MLKLQEVKDLNEEYITKKAWGLLTSIDLHHCNPDTIRDAGAIKQYVEKLCEMIDMKRFGETQVVNFGSGDKAGFSMTQLIETSLISGHFANESNTVYIDIFSCKYYDPQVAADYTQEYFQAKDVKIHYILRK